MNSRIVEGVAKAIVGGLKSFKTHRKDAKNAKFRKEILQEFDALVQNSFEK